MSVIGADDLRVTHPCASGTEVPLDLHVLSMPPAFVLSQDQTLRCRVFVQVGSGIVRFIALDCSKYRQSIATLRSFLHVLPVVKEHRKKQGRNRSFYPARER
jgi:hypothetical protein